MQPMSVPQEATPLALGERLEGYEIESVLARGRFTFSYAARAVVGGAKVVVTEFLPHEFALRDGMLLRARDLEDRNALRWWMRSFLDRAGQLQAMSHPGLVKVLRNFEANGTGYYVSEASSGETLSSLLEREGTLNEARLRAILTTVLGGLERAHGSGLLHRDIRPQNIWLRADGSAALADFGILRAPIRFKSKTLTTAATPPYSAPEEYVVNGNVGTWSDIYALGSIAYRAVSGQDPVEARERERGVFLALASQVVRVRASDTLLSGIDTALQMIPAERPQSVTLWSELLGLDLNVVATPAAKPAKAVGGALPPQKAGSTGKQFAFLLAPLLVAAGIAAWFFLKPSPAPEVPAATSTSAVVTPQPAVQTPAPAIADTTAPAPTNRATVPDATNPAASEDLDKLVQELMARDKKAQAEIKEQQRLLDLQKQNQKALTTAKGVPLPPKEVTKAVATAPSETEPSDAAKHAKDLEDEIARLKAEQAAKARSEESPVASPAAKATAADNGQGAAEREEAERAHQKLVIARARQSCRIPAMDLSSGGNLTYDTAMKVAGAEKLGSGAIRLPEITLPDGRTETFLITPDSCARIER